MGFPDQSASFFNNRNLAIALLSEAIILLSIWLYDEYLGRLVTVIAVVVPLGVLVVSLFAEIIEKSNISKRYFLFILALILLPLLMWIIFYMANKG